MKKILIVSLSFSLLCLLAACEGCKKNDIFPSTTNSPSDTLPPITTTGENTFGCLVDGKVWTAKGAIMVPKITGFVSGGIFNIGASRLHVNQISSDIDIRIEKDVFDTGLYSLNFKNLSQGRCYYYLDTLLKFDSNFYYVDTVHTGMLHLLKRDTINHIISGTFEFEAYNAYLQKSVHITQGRFDFQYIH